MGGWRWGGGDLILHLYLSEQAARVCVWAHIGEPLAQVLASARARAHTRTHINKQAAGVCP